MSEDSIDRIIIEDIGESRIRVALRRAGNDYDEVAGDPVAFIHPFSSTDRESLRWYLEDYLQAPYAVYEQRGLAVQASLARWGHALFDAVFGPGKQGRDAYLRARERPTELAIISRSSDFLGLPWELLRDPQKPTPVALDLVSFDRTLQVAGPAVPTPPGEDLRVLMVIARPSGLADVGYQIIARPLVDRLQAVRGNIDLDVLRPPTFEALDSQLKAARDAGRPYHIVHFDGHGTFGDLRLGSGGQQQFDANAASQGYLAFEADGGGEHLVSAAQFALAISQGRVPIVVLNACRSGMMGEAQIDAAVASRLLEAGAASVVAMGYSVYAVAAAEFMAAFYEMLFAGQSVSAAVAAGRRRLYVENKRPSPKGMMPLEDWIVPVHYRRRSIGFQQLRTVRAPDKLSLDTLLERLRPGGQLPAGTPLHDPLAPDRLFVGRDAAFYTLELAMQWQRVVVVHGPAGTGKTELAKAFGRWWQATGGVDQPEWIMFHSFEPGVTSFGLDGAVTAIGLSLFGPDFIARAGSIDARKQIIIEVLRSRKILLIWDNFETVRTLPDGSGTTPPLDAKEQLKLRDFLNDLARLGGRSGVVITSRTTEEWLGDVRRVELGGLSAHEAAEMAEDVLKPYPNGRARRRERAFAELLEWLDGHPLSIRVLLPQLETTSPTALLSSLKGNAEILPPGFVGDGRTAYLGASLKYSLDHLAPQTHQCLDALSLFEGFVDQEVLGMFSISAAYDARFSTYLPVDWDKTLEKLAYIGLLTAAGCNMYALHPALPAYLAAEWRRRTGSEFDKEHAAANEALLDAYAEFGGRLMEQIQDSGATEEILNKIDKQRRTMYRLIGLALQQGKFDAAQSLVEPLEVYWYEYGLSQEALGWLDRCRAALDRIYSPDSPFAGVAGAFWLFLVGCEAKWAIRAGQLDAAFEAFSLMKRRIESSPSVDQQQRLAAIFHELGRVAQLRGDYEDAEQFYHKSLNISEDLYELASMAISLHHLGIVAQLRGDTKSAESHYRRSLQIQTRRRDQAGIATSYYQIGSLFHEKGDLDNAERWYQQALEILVGLRRRYQLAVVYHQLGIVAQDRCDFALAENWLQKSLEIVERDRHEPGMAASYHQLGIIAQARNDFAGAEAWYHRARELRETLKDRPGLAATYGQLGLLFELQGHHAAALEWTVRCISLFTGFPNPATGPAPEQLVRLVSILGKDALNIIWNELTGSTLPDQIKFYVEQSKSGSDGRQ